MKLLASLFVVLLLSSVAFANDLTNTKNRHPSRLNAALCAALSEVIWNGEYEEIFDHYIGAGNYIIPNPANCKKSFWPGAAQTSNGDNQFEAQYFPLYDVLESGILSFAGYHNPPFTYTDGETRRVVDGAEYWLAKAIAARFSAHYLVPVSATFYDVTVEDSTRLFDLVAALANGASVPGAVKNIDVIMGTIPLTRAIQYFITPTCPYFYGHLSAVRTELDPQVLVTTVWDMQTKDVSVGVIQNSNGYFWALNALPEDNIVTFSDVDNAQLAINKGGVHVFVSDNWQLEQLSETCLGCTDLDIWLAAEPYVMGTRFVSAGAGLVVSLGVLIGFIALHLAF